MTQCTVAHEIVRLFESLAAVIPRRSGVYVRNDDLQQVPLGTIVIQGSAVLPPRQRLCVVWIRAAFEALAKHLMTCEGKQEQYWARRSG